MEKAGNILKKYFETLNIDKKTGSVSLFRGWNAIVDSGLASHSEVIEIEKSIIFIRVDHPGWAQTIAFKKKNILKKIKKKYPDLDIKDIRVFINKER
ncbi:MAG: DUF721 domain-containing protein [Spirochaetales bacterium]|nr:DUF721 domain-containing protein [Spirochaetales bacterium]